MHIATISPLISSKFLGDGKFLESREMSNFRDKEKTASKSSF